MTLKRKKDVPPNPFKDSPPPGATRPPGKTASSAASARSKFAPPAAMISAQIVGRRTISDVPVAPRTTTASSRCA